MRGEVMSARCVNVGGKHTILPPGGYDLVCAGVGLDSELRCWHVTSDGVGPLWTSYGPGVGLGGLPASEQVFNDHW